MKFRSIRAMHSRETAQLRLKPTATKKLRSELPRRRRAQISPILYTSHHKPNARSEASAGFSVNSTSCSYFAGEISCESSRVSVGSESEVKSKKRSFGETEAASRKVTRSSYGGKSVTKAAAGDGEVEGSESSCVESNSGAHFGGFDERKLKLKTKSKVIGDNEVSEAVTKSKSNKALSLEFKEQEVISLNSGVQLFSETTVSENKSVINGGNRAPEFEFHGGNNYFGESVAVSNSESTIEQRPQSFGYDADLACTEEFSYDFGSEYSSSQSTLSDFQSDPIQENSEIDFSDYSPSFFIDSGSQFSQGSVGDSPSPTFALLIKYREEFSRSVTALALDAAPRVNEVYKHESAFLKFEDDEVEESYQMLRNRERLKVFLRDYTVDYSSTTEYGGLILQQRSYMVRWIIEVSTATGLQPETKFLGVNLLDRFLSKGFFKKKRILQIVGIACLTLATRIEENQPYNSVREKSFYVGSNTYSRSEVVAMEWLVLEVLNFQCFLPTSYNFLWFYLKAAEADEEVEARAKYLAGLQLSNPVQLCYWPSTVAAAVVILASLEGNDAYRQQVIETHVRTIDDNLHECMESLEWLLRFV